jgi:hypothetical protein
MGSRDHAGGLVRQAQLVTLLSWAWQARASGGERQARRR